MRSPNPVCPDTDHVLENEAEFSGTEKAPGHTPGAGQAETIQDFASVRHLDQDRSLLLQTSEGRGRRLICLVRGLVAGMIIPRSPWGNVIVTGQVIEQLYGHCVLP